MSSLIVKVERVSNIYKHPDADRLSIVEMEDNDWSCVVGLDQYKVGDSIIFVPPDSAMPDKLIEEYKLDYLRGNGRVRTVRLRNFISQGLILPNKGNWKVGKDVAKELGITKYEPPVRGGSQPKRETFKSLWNKYKEKKISFRRLVFKSIGLIKDKFKRKKNPNPLFNKYTDIENIKNYKNIFSDEDDVVLTEKTHGSNARYSTLPIHNPKFWNKEKYDFYYGSHNVQLIGNRGKNCYYGEDIYGQIAERYNLAEIIPKDHIIYGEIYGTKIQSNYDYGLKDSIDVVFFDVKKEGRYMDYKDFTEFCKKRNLPMVPELYVGKYSKEIVEDCTKGASVLFPGHKIREGCVVKSLEESMHPRIGRKILKSINTEYLLIKDNSDFH